jgi:hypothetical protein
MKTRTIALAVLATLILAFVATPPALAQKGSFELSLGAGLTTLDDKLGGDTGGSLDFRVGYFVTDWLVLELQSAHASTILEGSFSAHTLNAVYHFEVEGDFVPYVLVGAGTADVEEELSSPPTMRDSLLRRFMSSGVAGQDREADPEKRRFAA